MLIVWIFLNTKNIMLILNSEELNEAIKLSHDPKILI